MTSASMHNAARPVAAALTTRERLEEVELLRRAQAGERSACETVVRRFGQTMHRTARRILRSEADSADAVQDAFLSRRSSELKRIVRVFQEVLVEFFSKHLAAAVPCSRGSASSTLAALRRRGLIEVDGQAGHRLTAAGRARAGGQA